MIPTIAVKVKDYSKLQEAQLERMSQQVKGINKEYERLKAEVASKRAQV